MTETVKREPFRFGQAIFKPFFSGPGSLAFIVKSMLFYALALTIMLMLFGKMLVGPVEDYVQVLIEMENSTNDEESLKLMGKLFNSLGRMILPYLLVSLGAWAVWASIEAVLYRRILLGEYGGAWPYKFKGDELRIMLAHFIMNMLYQVLSNVLVFFVTFAFTLVIIIAINSLVLNIMAYGIATILSLAGVFLMIWVLTRLAPTAALSVANKNFAIGEAWPVTKGRLWPTIGAYAFHYIIGIILIYIFMGLIFWAFLGSTVSDIFKDFANAGNDTNPSEIWEQIKQVFNEQQVKTGLWLASFFSGMILALWFLFIAGVSAHITELYQKDKQNQNAQVFE